ncbi:hypothetical protein QBC46DRAFT_356647 [Diplogelasinospora grovesii]|uniref:Cyanovirin-N domain-containing protein n=1 Tax=Diplogelasinospora grovesii TaxID=303347 RepID=A0AAN6S1W0_9PEZI|nr:hypothetical protein QBC46DRAFT_356647 [Diplogelasinospora grovesii]
MKTMFLAALAACLMTVVASKSDCECYNGFNPDTDVPKMNDVGLIQPTILANSTAAYCAFLIGSLHVIVEWSLVADPYNNLGFDLKATCRKPDGTQLTTREDLSLCFINSNGNLYGQDNGGFAGSCTGCRIISGTILDCLCWGNNWWQETSIDMITGMGIWIAMVTLELPSRRQGHKREPIGRQDKGYLSTY